MSFAGLPQWVLGGIWQLQRTYADRAQKFTWLCCSPALARILACLFVFLPFKNGWELCEVSVLRGMHAYLLRMARHSESLPHA